MEEDRSYFMKRAEQERSAADSSSGNEARGAHEELERRYRELVEPKEPISELRPAADRPLS